MIAKVSTVELLKYLRDPVAAGLGQDVLELREFLVNTGHQEVPVAGLTVVGHVLNPDRLTYRVVAVVR